MIINNKIFNNFLIFSIFLISLSIAIPGQQLRVAGKRYGYYTTTFHPQIVGGTILLNTNSRVILLNGSSSQNPGAEDWALFNLLGKRLSFAVDISGASCGCIAALYLIDIGGKPGYCDANKVDGRWCAELDIFEGNNHGLHVTPHCCCAVECNRTKGDECLTSDNTDPPVSCDRPGINDGPWGVFDRPNPYNPGEQYHINTQLPYRYEISFPVDASGNLAGIAATLSQSGRTTTLNLKIPPLYLNRMTGPMSGGMGLAISLWKSSDIAWLDGGVAGCTPQTSRCTFPLKKAVSFSNLAISTVTPPTISLEPEII